jgi:hypothetical protein
MYIDTAQLPEEFRSSEYISQWKKLTSQGVVNDPTKNMSTVPGITAQGLWSQISTHNQSVYRDSTTIMSERIDALELQNKFLSLSIFMLQGKFNQEEVDNIKDMLTSNDEASITLADTIIESIQL